MGDQTREPSRPETGRERAQPRDAGKTSGGGSLGHDQPDVVEDQTHTRNRARTSDPVMPDDRSSLTTKI